MRVFLHNHPCFFISATSGVVPDKCDAAASAAVASWNSTKQLAWNEWCFLDVCLLGGLEVPLDIL